MYKRVERKITAAVTPQLEPGETLEVVTFASIGGPSFKKTVGLAALTAVATAGAGYATVMPKARPVVLTNRRLITMDTSLSGGPGKKIIGSTPREQLRARRARGGLYLAFDLTDPQGTPIARLRCGLPSRADGRRIAELLGAPDEAAVATPAS